MTKSIQLVDENMLYTAGLSNLASLRTSEYGGKVKLITGYEYDILGNKTKVIDPRAYGYYGDGDPSRENYSIIYTYDILNRPGKVIRKYNNTDVYTQFGYDAVGNKTSVRNEKGFITTYTYDSLNRLKTVKDPYNNTVTYGYDAVGNKTFETNAKGDTMTYAYDDLNRLWTVTDPYNNIISTKQYDVNGNLIQVTDAKGLYHKI